MASSAEHKREYWVIFVWLTVLTILEVGIVYIPGIDKVLLMSALFLMAVSKATIVGWFYMHLKSENRGLQIGVAIPMAIPAFYAVVLIGEAAWRLL